MTELDELTRDIQPVDKRFLVQAEALLAQLTKPLKSLGRLEELAARYVAISRNLQPGIDKKVIFVFAADHGVTAEGVSAYPSEVTSQMVVNFLDGGAAVNVLAAHVGAEVKVVDIGVDHDFAGIAGLVHRKVRRGTRNICQGAAMTDSEAMTALRAGWDLAKDAKRTGAHLLGMGEMGIGNTTASSAILAVLLDAGVKEVTGAGTGVEGEAWDGKVKAIKRAIAVNRARLMDPFHVLAALGGLEISGLCGLVLGAASAGLPVVVDGFIASVAALLAIRMVPSVRDYLFFAHISREKGHRLLLDSLRVNPLLDLEMRLGEGTGAALAMTVIEAAVRLYSDMATFEFAAVSQKSA